MADVVPIELTPPRRRPPVLALLFGVMAGLAGGWLAWGSDDALTTATTGLAAAPDRSVVDREVTTTAAEFPVEPGAVGAPWELLFIREAGGMTTRAYRIDLGATSDEDCEPTTLVLELSTPEAVELVYWPVAGGQASGLRAQTFGTPEGAPATAVAVLVGPDVSEVRAYFGGGATDAMAPVDGVAVLTAAGPAEALELQAVDSDGNVSPLETSTYGGEPTAQCEHPTPTMLAPTTTTGIARPTNPKMPPPGEQPEDPVGAEAAVRAAYAELPAQVGFPPGSVVSTEEVVFMAPDRAVARYFIRINDAEQQGFGFAHLRDGRWQVDRSVECDARESNGLPLCPEVLPSSVP